MKLTVGVCYTKNSPHGRMVCKAFARGVRKVGDRAIDVTLRNERDALLCDVLVTCCIYNKLGTVSRYSEFRKAIESQPIPKICLDVGFIKNPREMDHGKAYMAIGVGGIKRGAVYANDDSPADRWEQLGIPLKPWRTTGDHVLLLGQVEGGSSTQHLGGGREWMEHVMATIRNYTSRRVVVRVHPNEVDPRIPQAFEVTPPGESLPRSLKNAWCSVSLTSNAAAMSVIQGIPAIAMDPLNIAYPISSHRLEDIELPRMAGITPRTLLEHPLEVASNSREQWAYDLAYAQWNPDEIAEGLPWQRLRSRILAVSRLSQA